MLSTALLVSLGVMSAVDPGAQGGLAITLAVSAEPDVAAAVKAAVVSEARELGVEPRMTDLPARQAVDSPTPDRAETESAIARARAQYVDGSFEPCLRTLEAQADASALLAETRRALASRLLLWRVSCLVGSARLPDARREAERFAGFGLEIPPDVGAVSPEVETLLSDALRAASELARHETDLTSSPSGARVVIDGRPLSCITPCVAQLSAGEHVVRYEAEGFVPKAQTVRVVEGARVDSATLEPAPPETASLQWIERYADPERMDSAGSMRLLSTALRSERMMLVIAERELSAVRLRTLLSSAGEVVSRAERRAATPDELEGATRSAVRELLVSGRIVEPAPTLVEQPLFWVVVGAVAAAAVTTTAVLVSQPSSEIGLKF